MPTIKENISLREYNTFNINSTTKYWVEVCTTTELQELLQLPFYQPVKKLILGGGSNILLLGDFDGLVIKMNILGLELINETDSHYWIKAGAGVNWHQFVRFCVDHNYAGVENLSLIPGTVGAAPMQNIGAYGVEIEQVFHSLEAVHIQTGLIKTFTHDECQFGYRESIFKKSLKDQYAITHVTFRLDKYPVFHTSYGAIKDTLTQMGISDDQLSIKAVSDAVIQIRQSKLPDPAIIGNAGSFFKNPEVNSVLYQKLKVLYPSIPGFVTSIDKIKIPAGWLIEQCGWKGKRFGDTGVHVNQALVLVNYGNASGASIVSLAKDVQLSVFEKFGIELIPEVNFI